jgi:uncharacterized protein
LQNRISKNLSISIHQVDAVLKLLDEGATIPFIARYRKEATGSLDEVEIEKIELEYKKQIELGKRKETIFDRLKELDITDENLFRKITDCHDLKLLEDLYLPYKPKRKTKASMARDLGLEPLAKIIMEQKEARIEQIADRYTRKDLPLDDVLQGARDIMAEWVSEHAYGRNQLRKIYQNSAVLISKVVEKKKAEAIKYKDYFDFNQLIKRIPSHRLLAILRAEKEGLLKVKIDIDKDYAIQKLNDIFIKSNGPAADHIQQAVEDGFKRLLAPSLETELRHDAKEKADEEAIQIFTNNLSQLLMAAPLGAKRTLALDPGFRSGCKIVCLNEQGDLVQNTTIYPHPPQSQTRQAEQVVLELIHKHRIEAIAVGNGTAGRETERFIKSILPPDHHIEVYLVNEDGASIYSASEVGRNEFPDLDLTVRGAISIGRRLIDPLAELVKIEPKSIGVGQYQHDVAQDKLKASLENTIGYAVNKVGVNLNTASQHLLQHVSGIGTKLAQNIVDYRAEQGPFKNRNGLKKVKGLGAKAFEQAAGFLRIKNGNNPLDASAVHPESYQVVEEIAKKTRLRIDDLIGNKRVVDELNLKEFISSKVGLPTLKDIVSELQKPGLDPRGKAKSIQFDDHIHDINDLKVGMSLQGKITNLTKFGAFVDLGIKENGLIHKSQIVDRFIHDPAEVLRLDQEVTVRVLEIDLERKRIQLSMKKE